MEKEIVRARSELRMAKQRIKIGEGRARKRTAKLVKEREDHQLTH